MCWEVMRKVGYVWEPNALGMDAMDAAPWGIMGKLGGQGHYSACSRGCPSAARQYWHMLALHPKHIPREGTTNKTQLCYTVLIAGCRQADSRLSQHCK